MKCTPASTEVSSDNQQIHSTVNNQRNVANNSIALTTAKYDYTNHIYQNSNDDLGIEMQSPGRDSPSSSSGCSLMCRHSNSSLDSGRPSSSCVSYDTSSRGANVGYKHMTNERYIIEGSYSRSKQKFGNPDELISKLDITQMLVDGVADRDVLTTWLTDINALEYFDAFVQAGYDMCTIARMTPEDLTAIGVTRPVHRQRLTIEINKLRVPSCIPDYIPESLDQWLCVLGLLEYSDAFRTQDYSTVQQALEISWEDLEDIGVLRLGHQKKLMLAIKKAKSLIAQNYSAPPRHHYTTQRLTIANTSYRAEQAESTSEIMRSFQSPDVHVHSDPPSPAPQPALTSYPPRPSALTKLRPVAMIAANTRDVTNGHLSRGGGQLSTTAVAAAATQSPKCVNQSFPAHYTNGLSPFDNGLCTVAPVESHLSVSDKCDEDDASVVCEDFPPPPPLPNFTYDKLDGSNDSEDRVYRNESSASFQSISSADSDSLPFARDDTGTIKQRPKLISALKQNEAPKRPADVLGDIGSMLDDLTDELDAMLCLES